ncbi:MAG: copper resistance protein CopC [Verrucomicrobia bacterium]|nr:copper resistance protein CopC [Verrucomicrobiota bacterium]
MKTLGIIISASAFVLFSAGIASAHAFLDHAQPGVGSTVKDAPSEVNIWFTEKLEPAFSSIQLFDQQGTLIGKRKATVDSTNPVLLRLPTPKLGPGTYKVVWKVMSVDTHVTSGSFNFTVAASR